MGKKTYSASCHCGAVRFEADIDLGHGVTKCNCSVCAKARAWFVIVAPESVTLSSGADSHTVYEWIPPGHTESNLHYQFCKKCGIRTFGRGEHGPGGKPFCFVSVAALDDVDQSELSSAPTRYVDGLHGHYDRPPADTHLM